MNAVPRRLTFSRGFSLVEMAVVLVIVALLIAGMMLPLSAQQDIRARQDTERTLKDVQEALLGFAVANGRLPCPATAASNGFETPVGGACACVSPDCFLPAATLGIAPISSAGQALDGWQNPIRYAVTSANSNAFSTVDGMKAAWGSLAPDLQICATGACANTLTSNAVAVVWSTGKNTSQGGTSADEIENPNPNTGANPDPAANTFVSRTSGDDFDDVVVWLSPNILYNRMITAGKLP
jgi:prepilin-type N-terminal cleavage/methylation domain-containing protein